MKKKKLTVKRLNKLAEETGLSHATLFWAIRLGIIGNEWCPLREDKKEKL